MSLKLKFGVGYAIFAIVAIVLGMYMFDVVKDREVESIGKIHEVEVGYLGTVEREKLDDYEHDIVMLQKQPIMKTWLNSLETGVNSDNGKTEEELIKSVKMMLANMFWSLPGSSSSYSQIRVLDENGQEIIRADLTSEGYVLTPKDELQDKSQRYYFQEAITTSPLETYFSKIDLNIENGVYEEPYTPYIRVARSLLDKEGVVRGIVIINVDVEDLFGSLLVTHEGDQLFVLDSSGKYLVNGVDSDLEYSSDMGGDIVDEHYLIDRDEILEYGLLSHSHEATDTEEGYVNSFGSFSYGPEEYLRHMVVLIKLPSSFIFRNIDAYFRGVAVVGSIWLIIVFSIMYVLLVRAIIVKVKINEDVVAKIGKGDLSARVKIVGNDEISSVAKGINQMAVELSKREDERVEKEEAMDKLQGELRSQHGAMLNILEDIDKAKKNVEVKVKERTSELEKAKVQISKGWLQQREEKAKLLASINSLPLGFFMIDAKHQIVTSNLALAKILNLQVGVIDYVRLAKVLKEAKVNMNILCAHCRGDRKPYEQNDVEFQGKVLRLFSTPVTDGDKLIGTVVLIDDVTEEKLLDRRKEEFFSIASHELRTPLTAIRGNSAMIQDYFSDEIEKIPEVKDMIEDMHISSVRLIGIVNDFLDSSRLEQKRMQFKQEKFDIGKMIVKVVGDLKEMAAEKGISLTAEVNDKKKFEIVADSARVEQVIVNLIGNGLNYTKEGGVKVKIKSDGEFVKMKIYDSGVGIAEGKKSLLFHKFQQAGEKVLARDVTQGTGMGLYVSKLLAEGMGGRVILEYSKLGVGSVFCLALPISRTPEVAKKG